MLTKAIEEANHASVDALANYVTNEALAAMPFAKIMRENGEHRIAMTLYYLYGAQLPGYS